MTHDLSANLREDRIAFYAGASSSVGSVQFVLGYAEGSEFFAAKFSPRTLLLVSLPTWRPRLTTPWRPVHSESNLRPRSSRRPCNLNFSVSISEISPSICAGCNIEENILRHREHLFQVNSQVPFILRCRSNISPRSPSVSFFLGAGSLPLCRTFNLLCRLLSSIPTSHPLVYSSALTMLFSVVLLAASLISSANAHGTITAVTGANGVNAAGFGIIADTPRDGSRPKPFEQDTSVIRDREIKSGKTGACGRTPAGGNNDVQSQLAAASNAGLPTTSTGGQLTMTLHQVNQDGAGPFKCEVSTDGGNTFQAAQVTQNVPGIAGISLNKAQDFPLTMQVAAGTQCAGGPKGDACIARCRNPALAGPFGSCVAFSMGGAAGGNATAAAADAANSTAAGSSGTAAGSAGAAGTGAAASNASAAGAKGAGAGEGAGTGTAGAGTGAVAAGAGKGAVAAGAGAGGAGAAGANAGGTGAGAGGGAGAGSGAGAAAAAGTGKKGGLLSKILGGGKRENNVTAKKRVINSRVAGADAGYWIDA